MSIATAPTLARKLVKSTGYIRQQLHAASKAEQNRTPGATAERQRITATFARAADAAESATRQAERNAQDLDRASLILKGGITTRQPSPMANLCAYAARLGADGASLAPALDHLATRAAEAADRARSRLEDADDDLVATALLCGLTARLPEAGFDLKAPAVKGIRADYLAAMNRRTKP